MSCIKERALLIESALNPQEDALEIVSTWSEDKEIRPEDAVFLDSDDEDYTQHFKEVQWALYESILAREGEHGIRQLYSNGVNLEDWLESKMEAGINGEGNAEEDSELDSIQSVSETLSSFTQMVRRIGQQVANRKKGKATAKNKDSSGSGSPKAGFEACPCSADHGASEKNAGNSSETQSVAGSSVLRELQEFLSGLPLGLEEDDRDSFQLEMDRFYTEWIKENGEIEKDRSKLADEVSDKGLVVTEDQGETVPGDHSAFSRTKNPSSDWLRNLEENFDYDEKNDNGASSTEIRKFSMHWLKHFERETTNSGKDESSDEAIEEGKSRDEGELEGGDACLCCARFDPLIREEHFLFDEWKAKNNAKAGCPGCYIIGESLDHILQYWRTIIGSGAEDVELGQIHLSNHLSGGIQLDFGGYINGPNNIHDSVLLFVGKDGPRPRTEVPDFLFRDTEIPQQIEIAKGWLNECFASHEGCTNDALTPPVLPRRVIDLREFSLSGRLALIESLGMRGKYCCLSYCWGKNNTYVATDKNIKDMMHDIPWEDLPQTYKDTVTIAAKLDFPFLWIDALCILQGNRKDWEEQSVLMGAIYGDAALTIAAANCKSTSDGFLKNCGIQTPLLEVPYHRTGSSTPTTLYGRRQYNHSGFESVEWGTLLDIVPSLWNPLRGRAWCFQEYFLSNRILHFGYDEMLFECNSNACCQCGRYPFPSLGKNKGMKAQWNARTSTSFASRSLHSIWKAIGQDYSTRRLTYLTDKLPALSGLAKAFENKTGLAYLAGHWDDADFLISLTWHTRDIVNSWTQSQSTDYQTPSWSWASLDAACRIKWAIESENDFYTSVIFPETRILAKEVYTATEDTHGAAVGGYIVVKGFCLEATLVWREMRGIGQRGYLRRNKRRTEDSEIQIDRSMLD